VLYKGHWRPLEEDGLPLAAIAVHAEIRVALMSRSAAVKLQVPLAVGGYQSYQKQKEFPRCVLVQKVSEIVMG
jgi:hypothetical protein